MILLNNLQVRLIVYSIYYFYCLSLDHVRSRSANPSDELKETTSPHETKLTQSRPNLANVVPTKKPPVPLPRPTTQLPDRKNSIESSAVLHQSLMPLVVSPPTLPVSSSPVEDSIYMEVVTDFSDPSYSSDISEMSTSSKNVDQLRMTVPIPPPPNPRKNSRADLSVVSLETTLPSKCMFFDFETTINGYHRRDPRTIIYPRTKSIMPKMTSDEINTLQRYFNT